MASTNHDHIKNLPEWKAARTECFDRDGWACIECESTEDLTADHRTPLAVLFAAGITPEAIEAAVDVDNLRTLCRSCNGRKGATIEPDEQRVTWVSPDYRAALGWLSPPVDPDAAAMTTLVF